MGNWTCKDFHYGSDWSWTGTEPFKNLADNVKHIGRGRYKKRENNYESCSDGK